ncbi:FAD-binding domain-containing protein [Hymenopellis radicata]|nr:FAD-binding domain-containing protein [Hymenopellis radicata]
MVSSDLLVELTNSGFNGDILHKPDAVQPEDAWDLATRTWGCQSRKDPKVVLKPKTTGDTSAAILWLKKHKIDFAVRSGGTAQSQSDQVILDLGHFNKVEYDESKQQVVLGPGQSWRMVYDKLTPSPVTVMGGRLAPVGVGGFLTGGGLCYLTNMYGLATKSVIDYQLVLADGRVIWASEDPELAQAMRGAGYSFGVITEIVVKAIPKPPSVYGGYLLYPLDKLEALAKRVEKLSTENTNPRISGILCVLAVPNAGTMCVLLPFIVGVEGEDPAEFAKRPEVFGWAWDLEPTFDSSGVYPFEKAVFVQDSLMSRPKGLGSWQVTGAMLSSFGPSVFKAGADWIADLHARPDGERFHGATVTYQAFMKGAFALTPETKGVWPPPGCTTVNVISVIIEQHETLPGHAEENATHMRDCVERIYTAARSEGIEIIKNYPNYLLAGSPAEEFYEDDVLEKLKVLKRKYDPENIFHSSIRIDI